MRVSGQARWRVLRRPRRALGCPPRRPSSAATRAPWWGAGDDGWEGHSIGVQSLGAWCDRAGFHAPGMDCLAAPLYLLCGAHSPSPLLHPQVPGVLAGRRRLVCGDGGGLRLAAWPPPPGLRGRGRVGGGRGGGAEARAAAVRPPPDGHDDAGAGGGGAAAGGGGGGGGQVCVRGPQGRCGAAGEQGGRLQHAPRAHAALVRRSPRGEPPRGSRAHRPPHQRLLGRRRHLLPRHG